jgi:Protein of unknown function (DUF4238)
MIPKGQHFIPRLHLQNFAGSQPRGQVWTYDAIAAKAWSAIPEETAVQTHFYSAEKSDGTMDTRIEAFLSQVEGRAAPVYQALLRGIVPKNSQARLDFAQFLSLMYLRTPAMRRMAAEIRGRDVQIRNYAYASDHRAFEALTRRFEQERGAPIDPKVKEKVYKAMREPSGYEVIVPKEQTLHVLAASDKLIPILFKMKWCLVFAEHGFFVTSDNPLVLEVDPKTRHPIYGDHGFLNKTAEVTFPLSPKVVLLLSWDEKAPEHCPFERPHVDFVNCVRAAHSDRYLYAHVHHKRVEQLAAEFKYSRPNMTTEGFGPRKFAPIKVSRRSSK